MLNKLIVIELLKKIYSKTSTANVDFSKIYSVIESHRAENNKANSLRLINEVDNNLSTEERLKQSLDFYNIGYYSRLLGIEEEYLNKISSIENWDDNEISKAFSYNNSIQELLLYALYTLATEELSAQIETFAKTLLEKVNYECCGVVVNRNRTITINVKYKFKSRAYNKSTSLFEKKTRGQTVSRCFYSQMVIRIVNGGE